MYFCRMRSEPHLLNYLHADLIEAGCDEAGRGPLAGPVYAAAVILPKDFHHPLLNDSKKMTEKAREILRPIIEKEAIAWAVEEVSAEEIDTINILNASITGMQRAVRRLSVKPPIDYRSLPRLSSPSGAKASTRCSCQLILEITSFRPYSIVKEPPS